MDYSLLVGVVYRGNGNTNGNGNGNTNGIHAGGGGTTSDNDATTKDSESSPLLALTPDVVNTIKEQDRILHRLEGGSSFVAIAADIATTTATTATATTATATTRTQPRNRRRPDAHQTCANLLRFLTTPLRLLASPPAYVARTSWKALRLTLDSIATAPMPYYGSGRCGVDGGKLSVLHGERKGDRAMYYLGLIDFLQPWTARKVLERRVKGWMGHDTDAISAVTPEEYAARFLKFLDEHVH